MEDDEGEKKMNTASEHEYTTYPRRFKAYRWYKPLLVGVIFLILMFVFMMVTTVFTTAAFGVSGEGSGYDGMDFFTAGGALANGLLAFVPIPALFIAALIVKDRPISSYNSSMGGWRWEVFLKTLGAAFVILGIPGIISLLIKGQTSAAKFTLGGFLIITLLTPLQGYGEELMYRGYITQTISSWFRKPIIGIIVQIVLFTIVHPYNLIGVIGIAVSALLYALACVLSKGLESGTAMHMVNNLTEILMAGFGFGLITSEQTVPGTLFNLFFKVLFIAFLFYADRKLHWFDKVKYDDVTAFNEKQK